ncbi:MAG TPA: PQQ-binding-like beta-propeller repeat protein, partial [Gemmataceae bacterium]|nr:PQQ-binding-like beta-propeller repeat protein [Gemmataceae bacterium]
MTTDSGRLLLLAALLVGAVPAPAQPPDAAALRGDSAQTRKRLAEAEAKALGDKPADAIDDLQRVLDDSGDDLIGVDAKHFRPARWVAHGILAKLRGDGLKAYQDRIDEPARKLLAAAKRDRDPRHLWALLDQYFVSRPSEEGLVLLGELLFERGEFRAAEQMWRRLLPDGDVPYPAPKTDAATIRAKVILATIFQGEHERAKAELTTFRVNHPNAAGVFAGKDGPLADTLQALLDHPPRFATPADRTWAMVGGGPERSGRVGGRFPIHWPSRPTWANSLPVGKALLGHPVIAGGRVYVASGARLESFDLVTGHETVIHNSPVFGPLVVAGDRLYARCGPQHVAASAKAEIACFGRPPNAADGQRVQLLWKLDPPDSGEMKVPAVWEGAPLVSGRRMWAVLARFEGGRVGHAIACYDPADTDRAPDRPAWVTEVSDGPLSQGAEGRTRQEILTLAGRNVVFCTHTGAVVALDAATGRKAWAFRYPRSAKRVGDAARSPDPAPAIAFGGRVFVAPADADRVYALDGETGQPLWESAPADGAQLLGVSRGRLIVTVSGQVRGIRALSVVNGSQREPDGWVQHDGGGLPPHGRGLVADDVIVWPTKAGVFFLDPDNGQPMRDPLRTGLPFPQSGLLGNVAFADGCMVIVTASQVLGYVSEAKRFGLLTDPAERAALAAVLNSSLPRERAWADARLLFHLPAGRHPHDLPGIEYPDTAIAPDGSLLTRQDLVRRRTGAPAPPGSRPSAPHLTTEEAPSLNADADIDHTVSLPPGSHPLQPIRGATPPKHLFAVAGSELVRVALKGGALQAVRTDDALTHAADLAGGFVAAGPRSVAVYGEGAQPDWVFRVPEIDPIPAQL